jgi:glycosyltransferase involved in cell wall biosynthesis
MRRALILVSNLATNNGVASCIMNNYEKLHTICEEIDFLVLWDVEPNRLAEITYQSDRVLILPEYGKYFSSKKNKFLRDLIRERKYDIVHVNVPNHNGTTVLFQALLCGVGVRIYHAHAQKVVDTLKNKLKSSVFDKLCKWLSNYHLACSETVGEQMFNKSEYDILHNAIDAERFVYDAHNREEIRSKYGLSDCIVVGVVGRMTAIKNPLFIIDVIYYLHNKGVNVALLWLGSGEMREKIELYIRSRELTDNCFLIGSRNDVYKWYSAMDVFLFPSISEGLGMSLIEAQVSGLPCFASNRVPKDTGITDKVSYLSLDLDADEWAERIIEKLPDIKQARENLLSKIQENDFDIKHMVKDLNYYYRKYLHKADVSK